MVEVELKFQLPAARRAKLEAALGESCGPPVRLHAQYFDTAERHLARAGLRLCLWRQGEIWMQTLRSPAQAHELCLGLRPQAPALDVLRHAEVPLGQSLLAALGKHGATLALVWESDVLRRQCVLHGGDEGRVELIWEQGELRAGPRQQALCELVFALKSGSLATLIAVVSPWLEQHPLWLDSRARWQQGERLANDLRATPAIPARPPRLRAQMLASRALRAMVAVCLEQILPNCTELAAGEGHAEHLHQARVGMRRLRSALRLFGNAIPGELGLDLVLTWDRQLALLASRLGGVRDQELIAETLRPARLIEGAPSIELPRPAQADEAQQALRAVGCTRLMLALLQFAYGGEDEEPDWPETSIQALAHRKLKKLRRRLLEDASAFQTMDDAMRHSIRKRLKRLRYGLEFLSSLSRGQALKRCLDGLRPAQDALGRYNDLCVAEAAMRHHAQTDPRAWFYVGWLSARREQQGCEIEAALQKALAGRAWRALRFA